MREGDSVILPYSTRSPIEYSVPILLYQDGGIIDIPSETSSSPSRSSCLAKLFNIWTTDWIHQSLFEECKLSSTRIRCIFLIYLPPKIHPAFHSYDFSTSPHQRHIKSTRLLSFVGSWSLWRKKPNLRISNFQREDKIWLYHWLLIHEIIVTPIFRPMLWIISKLHPLPHWLKCNQSTNYRAFKQSPLHPGNNLAFQDIQWNGIPRQPLHRLFPCIAMIERSLNGRIQYAMPRLRHWRFLGCLIVFENLRTPAQPSRHFYPAYRQWV